MQLYCCVLNTGIFNYILGDTDILVTFTLLSIRCMQKMSPSVIPVFLEGYIRAGKISTLAKHDCMTTVDIKSVLKSLAHQRYNEHFG